jgi:hypothetical protein
LDSHNPGRGPLRRLATNTGRCDGCCDGWPQPRCNGWRQTQLRHDQFQLVRGQCHLFSQHRLASGRYQLAKPGSVCQPAPLACGGNLSFESGITGHVGRCCNVTVDHRRTGQPRLHVLRARISIIETVRTTACTGDDGAWQVVVRGCVVRDSDPHRIWAPRVHKHPRWIRWRRRRRRRRHEGHTAS